MYKLCDKIIHGNHFAKENIFIKIKHFFLYEWEIAIRHYNVMMFFIIIYINLVKITNIEIYKFLKLIKFYF